MKYNGQSMTFLKDFLNNKRRGDEAWQRQDLFAYKENVGYFCTNKTNIETKFVKQKGEKYGPVGFLKEK